MSLSKETIFEEIQTTVNRLFGTAKDDITAQSRLVDDLELDSIDAVDLIVELQRKTDRKIKPDRFKTIRTVGDIVDVVHEVLQESE